MHLFAGKLRFLDGVPRSRWLSFAGGVSVAYVVVRILPELSAGQREVDDPANALMPFLEHHVYLLTLAGLVAFYGVERSSTRSRLARREAAGVDATDRSAFAVSIGGFAAYNLSSRSSPAGSSSTPSRRSSRASGRAASCPFSPERSATPRSCSSLERLSRAVWGTRRR